MYCPLSQALGEALSGERAAIAAARQVPSTLTLPPGLYAERMMKLGELLRLPPKASRGASARSK